ncbi:MAG: MBL fold metallo-hydrolase [Patescibacteria group bacterium]
MEIKKIGHSCLFVKVKGEDILIDPGYFTVADHQLTGLNTILISHEHKDHFDLESLQELKKINPQARVITNQAVALVLDENKIDHQVVSDGEEFMSGFVSIKAFNLSHSEIYKDRGMVENTGFLIDDKFLFPGDSFSFPTEMVEILALPITGPFACMKEVLTAGLQSGAKKIIPVHDGMIKELYLSIFYKHLEEVLGDDGKQFVDLRPGASEEFK